MDVRYHQQQKIREQQGLHTWQELEKHRRHTSCDPTLVEQLHREQIPRKPREHWPFTALYAVTSTNTQNYTRSHTHVPDREFPPADTPSVMLHVHNIRLPVIAAGCNIRKGTAKKGSIAGKEVNSSSSTHVRHSTARRVAPLKTYQLELQEKSSDAEVMRGYRTDIWDIFWRDSGLPHASSQKRSETELVGHQITRTKRVRPLKANFDSQLEHFLRSNVRQGFKSDSALRMYDGSVTPNTAADLST